MIVGQGRREAYSFQIDGRFLCSVSVESTCVGKKVAVFGVCVWLC